MNTEPETGPGEPRNAWLRVTVEQPFKALHATLEWEPYLHGGDGYKAIGYRRADGMGYVLPICEWSDEDGYKTDGRWWATWAHPKLCGRPGWHHHALGTYSTKESAAMAFDQVYDLERIAGNRDRMSRNDAQGAEGSAS